MQPNWSAQDEFKFRIREALDTVTGVGVSATNGNGGVTIILVKELTANHPLLQVVIPFDGLPEITFYEMQPNPKGGEEGIDYKQMAVAKFNFNVKRFAGLRNQVNDAITRGVDRARRDFALRGEAQASGQTKGVNIQNSTITVNGDMVGGDEINSDHKKE